MLRLVKRSAKYVGKDNKEHQAYNYYIVSNEKWIPIKASFVDSYKYLEVIAETVE